ncbi:MAG: hypothetical protein WBM83_15795 [Flavobacteriaceae bacterium]
MRNLVLLFAALIFSTSGVMANSTNEDKVAPRNAYRYNNSFIFVENGITFSVYPDGEFDFYIDNYVNGHNNKITFNSGYDYSPYAQYDDYGAVIQVENTPIYYDYYGRVTQIGDVDVAYRNGRVFRMGGMYVYYNNNGYYDYHTGYINVYNRNYVYRPFHRWFARPLIGFSLVFNTPYRRYYTPFRYTYYSPYRHNQRRAYATIGKEYRYNKVRRERATIYRNDKRVAIRENNRVNRTDIARSNRSVARSQTPARKSEVARNNSAVTRNTGTRSNANSSGRTAVDRSKRMESRNVTKVDGRSNTIDNKVSQRSSAVRSSKANTVSKRTVAQTPTNRTNTSRTNNRAATSTRSSVSKAPSRSTVSRSSSSRSSVSKAPSRATTSVSRSTAPRSSRSTVSRSSTSRSTGNNTRSASTRSRIRQ